MDYGFDRPVPARVGVETEKWDLMEPGLDPGIVPLSVADMEFASPPAIIAALEDTARSGLWGYTGWGDRYFHALHGWFASRHGWQVRLGTASSSSPRCTRPSSGLSGTTGGPWWRAPSSWKTVGTGWTSTIWRKSWPGPRSLP